MVLALLAMQFLFVNNAFSAPVKFMPYAVVQSNGDTLHLFVSGDEFYNWLHDSHGYVVVRDTVNGEYRYAYSTDNDSLVVSPYAVPKCGVCTDSLMKASIDAGAGPFVNMGDAAFARVVARHSRRASMEVPQQYRPVTAKTSGFNHGRMNNLVIFIRFSDESRVTHQSYSSIEAMFNDSVASPTDSTISMFDYFRSDSYNKLSIVTHLYPQPTPGVDSVLSYQDYHPRAYFEPFSPIDNPIGYTDQLERQSRELTLIENAINWVNANNLIPPSLDLDMDNDGLVDNVCFIVSGTYTLWSGLLWPHKWSLFDRTVLINGKRVYTFNLQLAESGSHYFSVSTFCHEMTHTLGAPDLYHYNNFLTVSTAGAWDLMHSNATPPQHTNSLFKLVYLNWMDSIPTLTRSGNYALLPHGEGENRAVAIPSMDTNECYVLEYRNNRTLYESALPGSGLLVWRFRNHSRYMDNAGFNYADTLHQLWLFRPNSSDDTTNGLIAQAAFGTSGRTAFGPATNPFPYLADGTPDTSFSITNIHISADGDTLYFTYDNGVVFDTVYVHVPVPIYDTVRDTMYNAVVYDTLYTTPEMRNLMVAIDPATPWGKVAGSGVFPEGTTVEIAALPNKNCRFVRWNDGNEENPRTILMEGDAMYRAVFDSVGEGKRIPKRHDTQPKSEIHDTVYITLYDTVYITLHDTLWITPHDTIWLDTTHYYEMVVLSGDETRGLVSGNGIFPAGTEVEIAAIAKEGYRFVHWHDNSHDNPRRVVMDDVQIYVAEFTPDTGSHQVDPDPDPEPWNAVLKYEVRGNTVIITSPASAVIRIFSADGRLVVNEPAIGDKNTEAVRSFTLPSAAVYLIQVGHFPVKRVVVM